MRRYTAQRSAVGWMVYDIDPGPDDKGIGTLQPFSHVYLILFDGLTQHEAEARARALNRAPPTEDGTTIRQAAMTLEDWATAHCITILPSGALIRWSCRDNPIQVVRDGGDRRDIEMEPAVSDELEARGERHAGPRPQPYMSYEQRRENYAETAMILAQHDAPIGASDDERDEIGEQAFEDAWEDFDD